MKKGFSFSFMTEGGRLPYNWLSPVQLQLEVLQLRVYCSAHIVQESLFHACDFLLLGCIVYQVFALTGILLKVVKRKRYPADILLDSQGDLLVAGSGRVHCLKRKSNHGFDLEPQFSICPRSEYERVALVLYGTHRVLRAGTHTVHMRYHIFAKVSFLPMQDRYPGLTVNTRWACNLEEVEKSR